MKPRVFEPGRADALYSPIGGGILPAVGTAETDGRMTAFESIVDPGQGPPLHTHANEDETIHVIAGELRFLLEGELHPVPAGATVFIPRHAVHTFQNVGETHARILIHFAPAGMERFFERFNALEEPAPEDFARLGAEVGMDVVGPPLAVSHPLD